MVIIRQAHILQVFFDRTFDSFIVGCGPTRKDAMADFAAYLKRDTICLDCKAKADRYLRAVDSVCSYS